MPSPPTADRPWSLTRRLALIFAAIACLVVLLYGPWSSYFVFDRLRGELGAFIEHEVREFAFAVESCDGSLVALREEARNIARAAEGPPCAFRVTAADGEVLAETGEVGLWRRDAAWVEPGLRPGRNPLTWRTLASGDDVARHAVRVAIVVDGSRSLASLESYLGAAFAAFVVAVVLCGLCGLWAAWRGLRWLRDVEEQVGTIDLGSGPAAIRLEHPPVEAQKLSASLNEMLARIHAGLAEMRAFTAGLAHELRSPMQNLIAGTEVTLLRPRAPDEYQRLLHSNLEELRDLSRAVENMIAFCRSSEPRAAGAPNGPFALLDALELDMGGERQAAEAKGVEVELTGAGDTSVLLDREEVLRVALNLVSNAIDWSPPGTTVRVDVAGLPDRVRLAVEDEGPGVPQAMAERIYEPFVSSGSKEGRRGGYGLGLAICRSTMRELGGAVWHDARRGGGTRFVAEFPRVPARNGVSAGTPAGSAPAAR